MRTKSNEKVIETQTVGAIVPLVEELRNENIRININPDFEYSSCYKIGQLNKSAFNIFNSSDSVISDTRAEINAGDYVTLEYKDQEYEGSFALFQFLGKDKNYNYHFHSWEDGRKHKGTIPLHHVKSMYKIVKIIKSFEPDDWELSVIQKEIKEARRKDNL